MKSKIVSVGMLVLFFSQCQSFKNPAPEKTSTTAINDTILINIKSTGRISSNHFCEIVVDDHGNTYMATFEKTDQGTDQISIFKISPFGEIIWELGKGNIGRATALSIDTAGMIWVVGWFTEKLALGSCYVEATSGSEMFLAQISPGGQCKNLWNFNGSIPFNLHINNKNEILIAGNAGDKINFENTLLNNEYKAKTFIAKFDIQGRCKWIKLLNADIQRIKSDLVGNFYVTGSFTQQLNFNNKTLTTTGRFDKDGFIMKIGDREERHWIRQFGSSGIIRYGYRTSEGGSDLTISKANEIYVLASLQDKQNDHSPYHLFLLEYDQGGKMKDSVLVAKHIAYRAASTIIHDQQDHLWISSVAENFMTINKANYSFKEQRQSFLVRYDRNNLIDEVILPKHKRNMLFRSATSGKDQIIFSGHYQDSLTIYNQTITNNGNHGIFLFLRKTTKY